ncbi:MAG: tetraacyldisaccharide 4'-kinase [Bacteroidales bacterium]|nr:tetraacyldisaccharide 4'-kinase [Bacteroidales bacterium]
MTGCLFHLLSAMNARKTLSWLLFPMTMWYAVGVAIRGFLFASGILKQEAPHVTTIGLGNLSSGGTGKTPHAEYLLGLLDGEYHVAYLSRGYKRESKGFVLCEGTPDPRLLGDEAAMIAQKFPHVTVAVCEKRASGVKKLMELPQPPQVIILDDAYQHRHIKPTCNILLTEFGKPYFKDHILPFGDLREFRSGKTRANMVIVTKMPENLDPIMRHNVATALDTQPCQKVFFSSMRFGRPKGIYDARGLELDGVDHFLVFTGVAHPDSLITYLKQYGAVTARCFGDHHCFSQNELAHIRADFDAIEAPRKVIITTEKDAARLSLPEYQQALSGLPIYTIPTEVVMQKTPGFDFDVIISSIVKENISFLSKLASLKFQI